jgi:2-oxoglutarate/2-oxoacid ferredoxin oxidoreductase subunit beta
MAEAPPEPQAPPRPAAPNDWRSERPTWCSGCGDYSVLTAYMKVLQGLDIPHENVVTLAGIGCSSRFPYFVNGHGVHFIHGRSIPLATGVSLARPDCKVFVFGGDGDHFSIGCNHLIHAARKNVDVSVMVMDNTIYGLTKKQTSPTTPIGFKSKTDPAGAADQPLNPVVLLLAAGATFVARTHASQLPHVQEMMERATRHPGFAVVQILSECVQFTKGEFDVANPRRGGRFDKIDEASHDKTDLGAAMNLALREWPGMFGVFYEVRRATKNSSEAALIAAARERHRNADDRSLLRATFKKMR